MELKRKRKNLLDGVLDLRRERDRHAVHGERKDNTITLFSRGNRIAFSGAPKLGSGYDIRRQSLMRNGSRTELPLKSLDSLSSRIVEDYMKYRPTKKKDRLLAAYRRKLAALKSEMGSAKDLLSDRFVTRAWNLSIVGAILLGMVSMSLIYRYLGPGASADSKKVGQAAQERQLELAESPRSKVLGAANEKVQFTEEVYFESVLNQLIDSRKEEFENKVREMVKGYPIEEMAPYIAEKDPIVAAFLVSIARKESLWGKRVPVLDGQDCYNYWGYRGVRKLMGTGGHTCFNSRQDAVDTVAKRLENLIFKQKLDTPAELVVWKCGSDCEATGGQAAANKWIADVNHYFKKFNEE